MNRKLTKHEEKLANRFNEILSCLLELELEKHNDLFGEITGIHVEVAHVREEGLELDSAQERDFDAGIRSLAESAIEIITEILTSVPSKSEVLRELVRQLSRLTELVRDINK